MGKEINQNTGTGVGPLVQQLGVARVLQQQGSPLMGDMLHSEESNRMLDNFVKQMMSGGVQPSMNSAAAPNTMATQSGIASMPAVPTIHSAPEEYKMPTPVVGMSPLSAMPAIPPMPPVATPQMPGSGHQASVGLPLGGMPKSYLSSMPSVPSSQVPGMELRMPEVPGSSAPMSHMQADPTMHMIYEICTLSQPLNGELRSAHSTGGYYFLQPKQ